jgi:hypothetical protein
VTIGAGVRQLAQHTFGWWAVLGETGVDTKHDWCVSAIQEYLVSSSGQMSLPAAARHRWHLDNGGPVEVVDLGVAVLTLPKGEGRRLLGDLVSREEHAARVRALGEDPDLATT